VSYQPHGLVPYLYFMPDYSPNSRTVAAKILSSVYGYTVKDTNDTLVRDSAALVENFTIAAIPASASFPPIWVFLV
jgi:hypothetical protein